MKERNKAVPASYLILRKGDEILFGLRGKTGYFDHHYALPAGHVEADELPLGALVREAREEIGIEIDPADAKLVHTMYRAKHDETGERADYFFLVEKWTGELKNMEPVKCEELKWFPLTALPEKIMPHNKTALECILRGENYSEVPYDAKYLNPTVD